MSRLTTAEIDKEYRALIEAGFTPSQETPLRQALLGAYDQLVEILKSRCDMKGEYHKDCVMGLALHALHGEFKPSLRDAANDEFWIRMSLRDVPDKVYQRWGENAEIRFWKKTNRIWLKSCWWYVYLSWQSTHEETINVLFGKEKTTDTILQLVDRVGKGFNKDVSREIMKQATINSMTAPLFRELMIRNTAHLEVLEPELFTGGIEGYVKMLIDEVKGGSIGRA